MRYVDNYGEGQNKKYAVLLKIKWQHDRQFYLMDMSSYKHEQEVLILDGKKFIVTGYKEDVCKKCGKTGCDKYEGWICKHC